MASDKDKGPDEKPASPEAGGVNSSRSGRFLKLAGLSARVSSTYTAQRVKGLFQNKERAKDAMAEAHVRNAERVAKTLGELKGAVMKVGQMVSAQADLLPAEFADVLSSLHQDAPPVSFAAIEAQIEQELGDSPYRLFKSIDETPFASASIGQVHRAVTDDGREVVVKVQYPGVDQNVDSDLKNLRTVLSTGGVMGLRPGQLKSVFGEIRARLHEELDFCREADNVRRFGEIYAEDPEVVVPKVVGERSAQRVLTLEFIECDRLETVCSDAYSQAERNHFGEVLERMYARQIFEHHLLHADPHPGNYGFLRDGRLVLFDYGCVKEIPKYITDAYRDIVLYGLVEDWDRVDEALFALGARVEGTPHPGHDFYRQWALPLAEPILGSAPFDFGEAKIHEKLAALALKSVTKIPYFKPPADVVFIDRTVAGLYGMQRKLRANAVWADILLPIIAPGQEVRVTLTM